MIVLNESSVLTRTSYEIAPGTGSQSKTTSLTVAPSVGLVTESTSPFAGPTTGSGPTLYDDASEGSVVRPTPSCARTRHQ